ncbi:MAG: hypothetical protein ACYDH9_18555 [Limisphaerales bacterium]
MKIDTYSLKARLQPQFLVLLPVVLAITAWLPSQLSIWKTISSFGVYGGLWVLLAEMGRDLGRKKQPSLYQRWGGTPSTRLLRHRDTTLDPVTLARYHAFLSVAISRRFPSSAEEQADTKGADALYESAVKFLLEATRDDAKFPLLLKENTSYGFRRNLWAMKPAAILICILALAACLMPIAQAVPEGAPVEPLPVAMVVSSISLLVLWFLRVTPSWVRLAAEAYALRLLAACDQIANTSPHPPASRIITNT